MALHWLFLNQLLKLLNKRWQILATVSMKLLLYVLEFHTIFQAGLDFRFLTVRESFII